MKNNPITKQDEAIAQLRFALDAIYSGRIIKARESIISALSLLDQDDEQAVDDEVLRMIKEK